MSSPSSHHLWGNVGYRLSTYFRFMNMMGFTYADHNPDSWEGWHWGGMHMWGFSWRLGNPEQYDLFEDTMQNSEMIVFWSSDPEVNTGIYSAHESTVRRYWMKDAGHQDGVHRPVLQPHRRPHRRQVVLAQDRHRPRPVLRHRLHLADRRHLRQGIRGHPRPRLR